MGGATPEQVVPGVITKNVEQAMVSKPVSCTPPWSLLQLLPLGSCLEFLPLGFCPESIPAPTSFHDGLCTVKLNKRKPFLIKLFLVMMFYRSSRSLTKADPLNRLL